MIKQYINQEIDKIKYDKRLTKNSLRVYLILLTRLISLGWNIIITRYRIRKIQKKGKIVFTKKRPFIRNKGYIEVGNVVRILSDISRCRISVERDARLIIGNNVRLNGPRISVTSGVIIEDNASVAPEVLIMDGDHHNVENHRSREGKKKPITIKENAWIASRAIIMKGVTVGKASVVAAGAVVTKDVPEKTVVAGVPAKVIKQINS